MIIKNSKGLSIEFLDNGSIKHIDSDAIRISLKSANPYSKSGSNIFLRKRKKHIEFKPLLGPESDGKFQINDDSLIVQGNWDGLEYTAILQLSQQSLSWQWSIDIKNNSDTNLELDLIYMQDVGLKAITNGLTNEYYVSQYLERLVVEDQNFGSVIYCRQNMKESVGNPWLMLACKNGALSGSTDGMQFYGKTYRETRIPESLLSEKLGGNYAGESSIIALQEKPFTLAAGAIHATAFAVTYLHDHPKASSTNDLKRLPGLFQEFGNEMKISDKDKFQLPLKSIFDIATFLPVDELSNQEMDEFFGHEKRHIEMENGKLLSFFCQQNNHVVMNLKETLADRPHGHILQAQAGFAPSEDIVSTTAFAFGIFNSHISQGNTNFSVLLSVCTSQFNTSAISGQRIIAEIDGKPYLLGIPSAFEMGLNHCRWIYKTGKYLLQVRSWTSKKSPCIHMDFKVLSGKNVRLLITHEFDGLNNWNITKGSGSNEFLAKPKTGSMLSEKFPKAQFRFIISSTHAKYKAGSDELLYSETISNNQGSLFILEVEQTSSFCMSIVGEVNSTIDFPLIENTDHQWIFDCKDAQESWQKLSLNLKLAGNNKPILPIEEILPWYGMNALTHFLTPYGLEQFSGAAWGTRDVSQGPIDLLLTMEKYDEAKQVLRTIFSNQNHDGGWPQWWMFDSFQSIRAHDSHGDVFYWVIIAISDYIKITGDFKILDEKVPYYHQNNNAAEITPISEHIDRLINMIVSSFIPGTAFVPFGGGDWNDSLQPVSHELASRMISSWTVEMNYQAFRQYSKVYEKTDRAKAEKLNEICERIKTDFNQYLIKDGIVAGYGLVEKDKSISVLLHPSDAVTGIKYSILPMNRGIISEIFTPEQAQLHQNIINKHLKGPDGARLMDRPLKYKGGIQTIFQRAESSTFFGREIGLMYIHEHIRYAESQARIGNADAFLKALLQAIPVDYRTTVPCGDIRQSNCYYSSSDVTFNSRYEADERYDEINTGTLTLKGGWRVYSSGPGIYVSMIVSRLLGLRVEYGNIILDPVIPKTMDGLEASIDFKGNRINLKYNIKEKCFGPKIISINGKNIAFHIQQNKYRQGGAIIPKDQFLAILNQPNNLIEITL